MNSDYISYDHYMYPSGPAQFLDNIEIVADACRATGRDLFIVIQASNSDETVFLNEAQLRVQAYLSLAYGAKVINWACWTAGWWYPDNQIVDSNDNYTSLYYGVKNVNSEVRAFSDIYTEYVSIGNFYIGQYDGAFLRQTVHKCYRQRQTGRLCPDSRCWRFPSWPATLKSRTAARMG